MEIESVYKNDERIPSKYANIGVDGGRNVSLPFKWQKTPEETKSFALAIVDHHPVANEFVHWLVIDIPADVNSVEEGASGTEKMPPGSCELNTNYGTPKYGGPRPPAGTGAHPYETTLYALNVENLDLEQEITLDEFHEAVKDKVLAQTSITGIFSQ